MAQYGFSASTAHLTDRKQANYGGTLSLPSYIFYIICHILALCTFAVHVDTLDPPPNLPSRSDCCIRHFRENYIVYHIICIPQVLTKLKMNIWHERSVTSKRIVKWIRVLYIILKTSMADFSALVLEALYEVSHLLYKNF